MSHHTKPHFPTKSKHLTTYRRTAACPHFKITTNRCTRHSSGAGISLQHKVSRAESCGIFFSFSVILACGVGYIKQRSEQASITTALSMERGNLGGKKGVHMVACDSGILANGMKKYLFGRTICMVVQLLSFRLREDSSRVGHRICV